MVTECVWYRMLRVCVISLWQHSFVIDIERSLSLNSACCRFSGETERRHRSRLKQTCQVKFLKWTEHLKVRNTVLMSYLQDQMLTLQQDQWKTEVWLRQFLKSGTGMRPSSESFFCGGSYESVHKTLCTFLSMTQLSGSNKSLIVIWEWAVKAFGVDLAKNKTTYFSMSLEW